MPYTSEATWQRDWPVSDSKSRIGVVKFAPLGHDFPGGVKSGDVLWLFTDLVEHLVHYEALGDGCWGWSFRPNKNNSRIPSRHGAGIAIDWRAPKHPNGVRGTWGKTAIAGIDQLLHERYRGLIRWGEHYHHTCDGMHFEINGSPAEVKKRVAELKALARPKPARTLPPGPLPGWFHTGCEIGRNSEDVRAALIELANPKYPPTAVLSQRVAGIFGYIAHTYGLPAPNGLSGLTPNLARAIADWHRG